MYPFELRGKQILVAEAIIYESSQWDAKDLEIAVNEIFTVYAVILGTREREKAEQKPYVYIDETADSARGFWLEKNKYKLL